MDRRIDLTKPVRLSHSEVIDFINDVKGCYEAFFIGNKVFFNKSDAGKESLFYVKIPAAMPLKFVSDLLKADKYYYPEGNLFSTIILVRSGDAAIGVFENGGLILHKVIKKYMVRKKQGKSQLSYLKEKGKSRLGSRIRLMQAKEFFKEIDEKLLSWEEYVKKSSNIFLSCPPALKSFLFKSNDEIAKLTGETNVKRLSFNIRKPGYKELLRAGYLVESAYVSVLTKDENESLALYESLIEVLKNC